MPVDWKTGLILKLAKTEICRNVTTWRGIILLSLTSKVSNKVILELFTTTLEKDIRKEKAGFRKGRSCSDYIFTLRQILEQAKKKKTGTAQSIPTL